MENHRVLAIRALAIVTALSIIGCTTPTSIIKEGDPQKINYAFTNANEAETKSCLESYWATRDIYPLFSSTAYQNPPLITVNMGSYKRLISLGGVVVIDIYTESGATVIRSAHQFDGSPLYDMVAKEAILKCSTSQKFSTLNDVRINRFTK